ncbi:MAG: FAD-dependent protein [Bacillota bacterium]
MSCTLSRNALDARKKNDIHFLCTVQVTLSPKDEKRVLEKKLPNVHKAQDYEKRELCVGTRRLPGPVIVAGLGPAGLFAAYALARYGYRPIVVERGKSVEERALDVERFWAGGTLDVESNVMFGEGGAGTFSDGKLTTRIKDPRAHEIIRTLIEFGAPESIGILAKPHIGTDRLRVVVANMRRRIESLGGEIRFSTTLTGISQKDGSLSGVTLLRQGIVSEQPCSVLVLATGQGARDTYGMLDRSGLELAPKAFAVGVRIEHEQSMIDRAQFGELAGHPRLGAAEYHLSAKAEERGVYTFCMCPGGMVVASSSGSEQVVTNGMSDYARDGRNANAAIVVSVGPEDFGRGALDGMRFQEELERRAFFAGGGDYRAPASRVGDFIRRCAPKAFGGIKPTYRPGVRAADLYGCLPDFIAEGVRFGILAFARQLKGFDHEDAVLTAIESRTSSPVRILRGPSGEATRVGGLYPVGEGAGYAGGIVSAAVDGLRAAEEILSRYRPD